MDTTESSLLYVHRRFSVTDAESFRLFLESRIAMHHLFSHQEFYLILSVLQIYYEQEQLHPERGKCYIDFDFYRDSFLYIVSRVSVSLKESDKEFIERNMNALNKMYEDFPQETDYSALVKKKTKQRLASMKLRLDDVIKRV